jgi:hypothetical protein
MCVRHVQDINMCMFIEHSFCSIFEVVFDVFMSECGEQISGTKLYAISLVFWLRSREMANQMSFWSENGEVGVNLVMFSWIFVPFLRNRENCESKVDCCCFGVDF